MNKIDVAFVIDSSGHYDISLDENGDLLGNEGLDTACLMSALCEKRANSSEITKPEFRRGDWSNELNDDPDYEVGSKFWLLDSARINQETLEHGIEYLNDGFQWMVDDNIISSVDTTGEFITRGIRFTVALQKPDNSVEKRIFEIYNNTRTI